MHDEHHRSGIGTMLLRFRIDGCQVGPLRYGGGFQDTCTMSRIGRVFCKYPANLYLPRFHTLLGKTQMTRFVARKTLTQWKKALEDHEKIIEALKRRDAEGLLAILYTHVVETAAEIAHASLASARVRIMHGGAFCPVDSLVQPYQSAPGETDGGDSGYRQ